METIGQQKIWTFTASNQEIHHASCTTIRHGNSHNVIDYMELARKVAELQFRNRDFVLLFRGQPEDYRNKSQNTSLRPSLFRSHQGKRPTGETVARRYERLQAAEAELIQQYGVYEPAHAADHLRLKRQQILRWSILQHYEVCPTPLLDVTHSLRIAASFASENAEGRAYVFVLAVPNLSGAITASAEAGLQIARLSSVCPPTALRPHIQEGYLLGEYPELTGANQKELYSFYEVDFGRRLIAKFSFEPKTFWKKNKLFPKVIKSALYPNNNDPLFKLAKSIKINLLAED